jgi:Flp pilus assembly protein TadG
MIDRPSTRVRIDAPAADVHVPSRPGNHRRRVPRGARSRRHATRGQAFAEFGIAAILLGIMMAGILEFGRAWSAVDVLDAAVRHGARTASTNSPATRTSAATASVRAMAKTYFDEDALDINLTPGTLAGTQPVITVTATGNIRLLFSDLLPIGTVVDGKRVIQITRSSTQPDEWVTASP